MILLLKVSETTVSSAYEHLRRKLVLGRGCRLSFRCVANIYSWSPLFENYHQRTCNYAPQYQWDNSSVSYKEGKYDDWIPFTCCYRHEYLLRSFVVRFAGCAVQGQVGCVSPRLSETHFVIANECHIITGLRLLLLKRRRRGLWHLAWERVY